MAILRKLLGIYNHTAEYALYLGDSDAIVSKQSQEGGCDAVAHFDGPMHTESPDDSNVWGRLTALLGGSTDNFSTNWFNPANRTFIPIPVPNLARSKENIALGDNKDMDITTLIENDSLIVTIGNNDSYIEHLIVASFEDNDFQASDTTSLKCHIPATFSGDIKIFEMD